jgi:hypothetical protein
MIRTVRRYRGGRIQTRRPNNPGADVAQSKFAGYKLQRAPVNWRPFSFLNVVQLTGVNFGDAQAFKTFGVIFAIEDVPLFAAFQDFFFL